MSDRTSLSRWALMNGWTTHPDPSPSEFGAIDRYTFHGLEMSVEFDGAEDARHVLWGDYDIATAQPAVEARERLDSVDTDAVNGLVEQLEDAQARIDALAGERDMWRERAERSQVHSYAGLIAQAKELEGGEG